MRKTATERRKSDGTFAPNENKYMFFGDILICLNAEDQLLFVADADKYEFIKMRTWGKAGDGYVASYTGGTATTLHRYLSNPKDNDILVDHINGNKKDNRISNLRFVNKSQNAYNSKKRINNKSGCTGVYYRKDTGKYTAELKSHNKKICLGSFAKKEDAIKARKKAENIYIGEYRSYDQQ